MIATLILMLLLALVLIILDFAMVALEGRLKDYSVFGAFVLWSAFLIAMTEGFFVAMCLSNLEATRANIPSETFLIIVSWSIVLSLALITILLIRIKKLKRLMKPTF